MSEGRPRRLPFRSKLGFGVGSGAEGLHSVGINAFLILYYQQVLGLSGSMAGIALLIALLFDAVSDPLAGAISDRWRSRWGRRHPMMALSAVPLAAAFFGLFCPPAGLGQTGLFAWLTTFAVLERLALTLYHIPHLALGAEMAADYNDRSTVFSYSSFFGWLMAMGGLFLAYTLFFPETPEYQPGTLNPHAYPLFAITFGIVMVGAILLCLFGTRQEIEHLPVPTAAPAPLRLRALLDEVWTVVRNRSFLVVFGGMLVGTLILNVNEILTPYMGLHFWGLRTDQLRWLAPAAGFGLPIALLLASLLPRAIDKRNTVIACLVSFVVIANVPICMRLFGVPGFPANGEGALLVTLLVVQFGVGCTAPTILILLNSIFADICDEIELESGLRLEGLVYSARSFVLKVTSGLGNLLGGIVLDLIAFPTGAAAGTVAPNILFKLGLAVGPIGGALSLLGMLFYLAYKLDAPAHAKIAAELQRRRAAASAIEPSLRHEPVGSLLAPASLTQAERA